MKAMANVHYWHWEDGGSKKDFTDSSDFWLQQVKWTNCCISNIIIQVYARHNQLNIDLLRNESGRATTPLSLVTGIQEAYSQPCREAGSQGDTAEAAKHEGHAKMHC